MQRKKEVLTAQNLRQRARDLAAADDFRPDNVLVQIRDKQTQLLTLFNRVLEPLALEPDKPPTYTQVQNIRGIMDSWMRLIEFADKKLGEVQRQYQEITLTPEARGKYEQWRRDLREQYAGKGPQYEMMIDNVARLHVYLDDMLNSGRAYSYAELQELSELERSYIEQLQSRTESTKVEVIEEQIQDASLRILHVVRMHVDASTLDDIIQGVKRAIMRNEAPDDVIVGELLTGADERAGQAAPALVASGTR